MRVKVNFGERNKKFMVHRLVAMAFIPNNDVNKTQVDHIDSNRVNNNVTNQCILDSCRKRGLCRHPKLGKRNWYKYKFINPKTGEVFEFDNSAKACKYFGVSLNNSTLTTKANTGTPVNSGVFEGWIIERELFKKVQRPSSAGE